MQIPTRLFLLLLAVVLVRCVGSNATRSPDYEYQEVQEVEASADEIYLDAQAWMAEEYVSSQDAIQLRDEENHRIIANLLTKAEAGALGLNIDFRTDLVVEARDGRFRMTGRDIGLGGTAMQSNPTKKQFEDISTKLDSMRVELATYIEQSQEEDDW
jgi:hypothetical protein